jgi:hypothetical protein
MVRPKKRIIVFCSILAVVPVLFGIFFQSWLPFILCLPLVGYLYYVVKNDKITYDKDGVTFYTTPFRKITLEWYQIDLIFIGYDNVLTKSWRRILQKTLFLTYSYYVGVDKRTEVLKKKYDDYVGIDEFLQFYQTEILG